LQGKLTDKDYYTRSSCTCYKKAHYYFNRSIY